MTERTTVRLPEDLVQKAKQRAAADGVSLTALIEEGLRRILDERRYARTSQRISLPVSTATGGLMPGINLDSAADLQEIDDLEYASRLK
jgi:hypothetical protein